MFEDLDAQSFDSEGAGLETGTAAVPEYLFDAFSLDMKAHCGQ